LFRLTLLCAVLLLPARVWCQSSTASPNLSLQQAVDIALVQNRLVTNEKLEVEKAAERVGFTASRRLPTFDVYVLSLEWFQPPEFRFDRGIFGVFPGLGPVPPVDTNISSGHGPSTFIMARATQPLTQLYRIGLGVRMSEISRELAEHRLRSKQSEVAHQVKRAYYAVLQLQSALASSEGTLKLYQELDRVVTEYVAQQVVLASESLDVKTGLAKEEYEALKLRNNLSAAKEQLNQLLGRDIRTEFVADEVSTTTTYEVELTAAQTRALAQRPELQEAMTKLRLAEYDQRMKKAEAIPEISLTFAYFSAFGVSILPRNASGVGLTLTWEPFDWGRRKHEVAEKGKTIEQARNGIKEAEAIILREVGDRFRRLQEARSLLRVSQFQQQASREKLRVATAKYQQEAVLYKEVLQTQAGLDEAQNNYQQALLGFWTARADFEKAIADY
jgi:outer membrane protein